MGGPRTGESFRIWMDYCVCGRAKVEKILFFFLKENKIIKYTNTHVISMAVYVSSIIYGWA